MNPPATRKAMKKREHGTGGTEVRVRTNHFKLKMCNPELKEEFFYQYDVQFSNKNGKVLNAVQGLGTLVMDLVKNNPAPEMGGKPFAYDGGNVMYTVGCLPRMPDGKPIRLSVPTEYNASSKSSMILLNSSVEREARKVKREIGVEISFAKRIPIALIFKALEERRYSKGVDALINVLEVSLRQHHAQKGCIFVGDAYYPDDPSKFTDIGGGLVSRMGFHSVFKATRAGLNLRLDVTAVATFKTGSNVMEFLRESQHVVHLDNVDWAKAEKALKNTNMRCTYNHLKYKIRGVSENTCREQKFTLLKKRQGDESSEIRVYDYYSQRLGFAPLLSARYPCLNVGRRERPCYIPLEFVELLPTRSVSHKALSTRQKDLLFKQPLFYPRNRLIEMKAHLEENIDDDDDDGDSVGGEPNSPTDTDGEWEVVRNRRQRRLPCTYDSDPFLKSAGISVDTRLMVVSGRLLSPPTLRVGNASNVQIWSAEWSLKEKVLIRPAIISRWAIASFLPNFDRDSLAGNLARLSQDKGIDIGEPLVMVDEEARYIRRSARDRVDRMVERILNEARPDVLNFILCILPSKSSDLYGPWKRKLLVDLGIPTQCVAPQHRIEHAFLQSLLLKINTKMGGLNWDIIGEHQQAVYVVRNTPTLIIGMDVHQQSGDRPWIAAVVGSCHWPELTCYTGSARMQSRSRIIEGLHNLEHDFTRDGHKKDSGMIRELVKRFEDTSCGRVLPVNIIIFRHGVPASDFIKVLKDELEDVLKACDFYRKGWKPKVMILVPHKQQQRTRFFAYKADLNVPPGTLVDDDNVCHPKYHDFFLCASRATEGTTRPVHYYALRDDLRLSTNQLQELVHSLSYASQESTVACSNVAPIRYASLLAAQMQKIAASHDETAPASVTRTDDDDDGPLPLPQLPILHNRVASSMFFC